MRYGLAPERFRASALLAADRKISEARRQPTFQRSVVGPNRDPNLDIDEHLGQSDARGSAGGTMPSGVRMVIASPLMSNRIRIIAAFTNALTCRNSTSPAALLRAATKRKIHETPNSLQRLSDRNSGVRRAGGIEGSTRQRGGEHYRYRAAEPAGGGREQLH